MSSAKDEIRQEMRARRKAASARVRADAAAVVCAKLVSRADFSRSDSGKCLFTLRRGSVIAVYLATSDEIDLSEYIKHMLWCDVRLVAPRWNGETYELAVLKGIGPRRLRRGPMGVMEPVDGKIVQPQDVSLWIVPGLAFTRDGRRLGYGGGWYDRLLASASKDSVKLGVAYSFQIVDAIPSEPHDVRLTAVVDDSISISDSEMTMRQTAGGFSASVSVNRLSFRRKFFACCLAVAVLLPLTLLSLAFFLTLDDIAYLYSCKSLRTAMLVLFQLSLFVLLIGAAIVDGPVEAEIERNGCWIVCKRRFLGILPLRTRRFELTPQTWFDSDDCNLADWKFGASNVRIHASGGSPVSPRKVVKTQKRTALALAVAMNRALDR